MTPSFICLTLIYLGRGSFWPLLKMSTGNTAVQVITCPAFRCSIYQNRSSSPLTPTHPHKILLPQLRRQLSKWWAFLNARALFLCRKKLHTQNLTPNSGWTAQVWILAEECSQQPQKQEQAMLGSIRADSPTEAGRGHARLSKSWLTNSSRKRPC